MLLVVDNGSIHTPDLKKYLKKKRIPFIVARSNSRLKTIMNNNIKGVILTGGPLLYDSPVNIENVDIDLAVLLDLEVPTLGICFGHQTISEVFDGRMKRMQETVHRKENIKLIKRNKLFKGLPSEFEMQEFHTDCISEIPYNFELVAKSNSCGVESIKHLSKEIYGVQFHPEASGEFGHKILDNFLEICGIKTNPPSKNKSKSTRKK